MVSVIETPLPTEISTALAPLPERDLVLPDLIDRPLDLWGKLRRFLVLGSNGSTYRAGGLKLSAAQARIVSDALAVDGLRTVAEIIAARAERRTERTETVLLAFAMAAAAEDELTRRTALAALPRVALTAADIFRFAAAVQSLRGWGRGLRRAIGNWYNAKDPATIVEQVIRCPEGSGWTHADLLRLGHPKAPTAVHDAVYRWIVTGETPSEERSRLPGGEALATIAACERLRKTRDATEAATFIRAAQLPIEAVPSHLRGEPAIWEALLARLSQVELLGSLGPMTSAGLLVPGSDASRTVLMRILDGDRILAERLHPLTVLAALKRYAAGRDDASGVTWEPIPAITEALEAAFSAAFGTVRPAGKRIWLAVDVSADLDAMPVYGLPELTARELSAAIALIVARIEPNAEIFALTNRLMPVAIPSRQRLADVIASFRELGGESLPQLDLPIRVALRDRIPVDTFMTVSGSSALRLADSRTTREVDDALQAYRRLTGVPARHVAVDLIGNGGVAVAPASADSLGVSGFDLSAPSLIDSFVRGAL